MSIFRNNEPQQIDFDSFVKRLANLVKSREFEESMKKTRADVKPELEVFKSSVVNLSRSFAHSFDLVPGTEDAQVANIIRTNPLRFCRVGVLPNELRLIPMNTEQARSKIRFKPAA